MSLQELHDRNPIMEIYKEIGSMKEDIKKILAKLSGTGSIGKVQPVQNPLTDEDEYKDIYKGDDNIL